MINKYSLDETVDLIQRLFNADNENIGNRVAIKQILLGYELGIKLDTIENCFNSIAEIKGDLI